MCNTMLIIYRVLCIVMFIEDLILGRMNAEESFEDDRILTYPAIDSPIDPKGLGHAYFTKMKTYQDKIVQEDVMTGTRETFSSLLKRCIRTAITMKSKAITPNDVVVLCTNNHLDGIVPHISTLFVGAKVASLDPSLSLADTAYLLRQVEPKMIFVIPDALALIEEAVAEISLNAEIVVFGDTDTHTHFLEFTEPKPNEEAYQPEEVQDIKDTAIIFFSSGTSGMPKGICLSHFLLLKQIQLTMSFGLDLERVLGFATVYWITSVLLWGVCLLGGTTRLVLSEFHPAMVWVVIDQFKPTFAFLAPCQVLALYSENRSEHLKSDSLKDIYIGGGPMLEDQVLQMKKTFPKSRVSLAYGQTKIGGFISCFTPNIQNDILKMAYKPSSSGTGVAGLTYKVVNPESGEILGPYQEGELRLKGVFQMNGYYNMDDSSAWDADGWLKTGDLVYYDEDKCFYVIDCCKEMLKFQSWHVPPAVVENVILSHPSIENVVVIGIPHSIDGDHPMAIVKLKEGASNSLKPEDIEKYVEQRVHDRQRLRGGVKIVDSLPLSPSGKVKRGAVKKIILNK